jgi:hypothetical protein
VPKSSGGGAAQTTRPLAPKADTFGALGTVSVSSATCPLATGPAIGASDNKETHMSTVTTAVELGGNHLELLQREMLDRMAEDMKAAAFQLQRAAAITPWGIEADDIQNAVARVQSCRRRLACRPAECVHRRDAFAPGERVRKLPAYDKYSVDDVEAKMRELGLTWPESEAASRWPANRYTYGA